MERHQMLVLLQFDATRIGIQTDMQEEPKLFPFVVLVEYPQVHCPEVLAFESVLSPLLGVLEQALDELLRNLDFVVLPQCSDHYARSHGRVASTHPSNEGSNRLEV